MGQPFTTKNNLIQNVTSGAEEIAVQVGHLPSTRLNSGSIPSIPHGVPNPSGVISEFRVKSKPPPTSSLGVAPKQSKQKAEASNSDIDPAFILQLYSLAGFVLCCDYSNIGMSIKVNCFFEDSKQYLFIFLDILSVRVCLSYLTVRLLYN